MPNLTNLLGLLLTFCLPLAAQASGKYTNSLKADGFRCTRTNQNRDMGGDFCTKGKLYVLVPDGLPLLKRVVFYAHGDVGVCGPGASGENFLKHQMLALRRNRAIAVFPHRIPSRNLAYPFAKEFERIDALLGSAQLPVTMAGHSWAGKFIPNMLLKAPSVLQRVDQVLLLDAFYDVDSIMIPLWTRVLTQHAELKIRAISSTTNWKAEIFLKAINKKFPGTVTNKRVGGDHCPTTNYFSEL